MTADNERAPLERTLSTTLNVELKIGDDGQSVLEVRDGETIEARISGGDDHEETLAGLRKLMDGLWLLQTSVAGQKYQAEHQSRIQAGEITVVDSEGLPDAGVAEAARRAPTLSERFGPRVGNSGAL